MSIADALSRIAALDRRAAEARGAPALSPAAPASSFAGAAAEALGVAAALAPEAGAAPPASPLAVAAGLLAPAAPLLLALPEPGAGARVLAAAESQLGAAEEPPGSNDGPAIAVYRGAVEGAGPGEPWCAYFASWAAAAGGRPLGDRGQGLGSVAEIESWARAAGRLLPADAAPAPGDLILFGDRHVGVVESVAPDGSLTTVEGNYAGAVARVRRSPAEATGYVRL